MPIFKHSKDHLTCFGRIQNKLNHNRNVFFFLPVLHLFFTFLETTVFELLLQKRTGMNGLTCRTCASTAWRWQRWSGRNRWGRGLPRWSAADRKAFSEPSAVEELRCNIQVRLHQQEHTSPLPNTQTHLWLEFDWQPAAEHVWTWSCWSSSDVWTKAGHASFTKSSWDWSDGHFLCSNLSRRSNVTSFSSFCPSVTQQETSNLSTPGPTLPPTWSVMSPSPSPSPPHSSRSSRHFSPPTGGRLLYMPEQKASLGFPGKSRWNCSFTQRC